jgi:hypothetical protein
VAAASVAPISTACAVSHPLNHTFTKLYGETLHHTASRAMVETDTKHEPTIVVRRERNQGLLW